MKSLLQPIPATQVQRATQCQLLDPQTLNSAQQIINDVRKEGDDALRRYADKFNERTPDELITLDKRALNDALDRIPTADRQLLERTRDRIAAFAQKQRDCVLPLNTPLPGGSAGHSIEPIENVACYAPGGRYPLPSTVLMTAVPARIAGCPRIVVASPNPPDIVLAAAAVAGADQLLAIGGAHAIAALAYGTATIDPVDLIVGPGNRWVTAAKKLVFGDVAIDMLAGPSELVVFADNSADAKLIAADLLAQAEHDPDARPILVTTCAPLVDDVNAALEQQLVDLPTAQTARNALTNGLAATARDLSDAIAAIDRMAPEHLALHCASPRTVAKQIRHAGAVFVGEASAEVLGDYGFGPNHSLPTGGAARGTAGLSVVTFLRLRTWLDVQSPDPAWIDDVARLASLEGLHAHRRSAQMRSLSRAD